MTPYISLRRRIIAWLIWHFEGYKTMDEAEFYIEEHPEVSGVVSLMRDYLCAKKAKNYLSTKGMSK